MYIKIKNSIWSVCQHVRCVSAVLAEQTLFSHFYSACVHAVSNTCTLALLLSCFIIQVFIFLYHSEIVQVKVHVSLMPCHDTESHLGSDEWAKLPLMSLDYFMIQRLILFVALFKQL